MEKSNQKACMECGESFRGRSDKKFCGDQCRNTYNNRCTQEANQVMRGVNCILRKNRRILEELTPGNNSRVSKQKLYERGFNFEFTTSVISSRDGTIVRFCYEYGYQYLQDEIVCLLKRNDLEPVDRPGA